VTLSGTVATQAQKTKAGQVAKGVEGVKSVRNNLTVSPSS
jgi:osmotically-inducible protein OsmY